MINKYALNNKTLTQALRQCNIYIVNTIKALIFIDKFISFQYNETNHKGENIYEKNNDIYSNVIGELLWITLVKESKPYESAKILL